VTDAGPTARKPPFKFSAFTRVAFSDTDAQGVVYYGRYMPYFDLSRVEYHRHLGHDPRHEGAQEFAARALGVEYLAPARFDDLLEVFVRIARIGRTSMRYDFEAYGVEGDVLLARATETVVLISRTGREPTPIDDGYRNHIVAFEGADCEAA
jgi:acyl-CoA thioester hydrolase